MPLGTIHKICSQITLDYNLPNIIAWGLQVLHTVTGANPSQAAPHPPALPSPILKVLLTFELRNHNLISAAQAFATGTYSENPQQCSACNCRYVDLQALANGRQLYMYRQTL